MILGIDLDNTIINYEDSFLSVGKLLGMIPTAYSGSKPQIKEYLIKQHNGQKVGNTPGCCLWKAYPTAKLMDGFASFLNILQASCDVELYIVSHKTKFAHHDEEKTNLRAAALSFLQQNNVVSSKQLNLDKVIFKPTLNEKVTAIRELGCNCFVDDLPKVLNHPNFPNTCKKFVLAPKWMMRVILHHGMM